MASEDGVRLEIIDSAENLSDADFQALVRLLRDSINGGFSIGFLQSNSDADLLEFWRSESSNLTGGSFLVVARVDGVVAGCTIITRESRSNARHRAEFRKLMVHSAYQRRGIASALQSKACDEAKRRGVTLLTLDSATGFLTDVVYEAWGWNRVGSIPDYATNPDGTLVATTYFYKRL
ncbi:MAG: GNAT family N-acetyltransferase [Phycisphaerae bacterium]|nr:GNAT family N-acetyltransferase [Phycisphaerae bacterium]